jgi:helix-turn-helix protein
MRTVMGTAAVGRLLGYSARRVRELIQEGSLGGVFINHRWIVTEQALKRFMRRRGLEL